MSTHQPHLQNFSQKYIKLEFLGKGTFGSVYKIRDRATNKIFAAKIIPLMNMSARQLARIDQERLIHSSLRHGNIIRFYQSYLEDGGQGQGGGGSQLIYVMEYCQYGDLGYYVTKRKEKGERFPLEVVMNILIQILNGINYLHNNNIIHRDIKPANIFITSSGTVKIADFGISKSISQQSFPHSSPQLESTQHQSTCRPSLTGTPLYSSPQICRNEQATFKSDIWAIGCVLYELCELKHAFEASNVLALATKISMEDVADVNPMYGDDINAIIKWMLEKDGRKRPRVCDLLQLKFISRYVGKFRVDNKDADRQKQRQSISTPRIKSYRKSNSQSINQQQPMTPQRPVTNKKSLNSISSSLTPQPPTQTSSSFNTANNSFLSHRKSMNAPSVPYSLQTNMNRYTNVNINLQKDVSGFRTGVNRSRWMEGSPVGLPPINKGRQSGADQYLGRNQSNFQIIYNQSELIDEQGASVFKKKKIQELQQQSIQQMQNSLTIPVSTPQKPQVPKQTHQKAPFPKESVCSPSSNTSSNKSQSPSQYYSNIRNSCIKLLKKEYYERMYGEIAEFIAEQEEKSGRGGTRPGRGVAVIDDKLREMYGDEYYQLAKAVEELVYYQRQTSTQSHQQINQTQQQTPKKQPSQTTPKVATQKKQKTLQRRDSRNKLSKSRSRKDDNKNSNNDDNIINNAIALKTKIVPKEKEKEKNIEKDKKKESNHQPKIRVGTAKKSHKEVNKSKQQQLVKDKQIQQYIAQQIYVQDQ